MQKNLTITKVKVEEEKCALNRRNGIPERRGHHAEGCCRNKGSDANDLSCRVMKNEVKAEEELRRAQPTVEATTTATKCVGIPMLMELSMPLAGVEKAKYRQV